MTNLHSPIGLIAGSGNFPLEFAQSARDRGLDICVVAHRGETDPKIESIATSCSWVYVGQVGKILKNLRKFGVRQAAFSGGISRPNIFRSVRLDLKALALLARIRSVQDDVFLRALASEVEKLGIEVLSPGVLLEKSVVKKGLLTKRAPSNSELSDARIGWKTAKGVGELEIGQTVVVSKGMVVAVEAIEGTDNAIRRGGTLAGAGCVVVKVSKPHQDTRLDLPAIGIQTIQTMAEAGARCLVLEHERALMLDPEEVVREANAKNISILVVASPNEL